MCLLLNVFKLVLNGCILAVDNIIALRRHIISFVRNGYIFAVDNIPQAANISSPLDARMVQINPLAVRKSLNLIMFPSVEGRNLLFGIT